METKGHQEEELDIEAKGSKQIYKGIKRISKGTKRNQKETASMQWKLTSQWLERGEFVPDSIQLYIYKSPFYRDCESHWKVFGAMNWNDISFDDRFYMKEKDQLKVTETQRWRTRREHFAASNNSVYISAFSGTKHHLQFLQVLQFWPCNELKEEVQHTQIWAGCSSVCTEASSSDRRLSFQRDPRWRTCRSQCSEAHVFELCRETGEGQGAARALDPEKAYYRIYISKSQLRCQYQSTQQARSLPVAEASSVIPEAWTGHSLDVCCFGACSCALPVTRWRSQTFARLSLLLSFALARTVVSTFSHILVRLRLALDPVSRLHTSK